MVKKNGENDALGKKEPRRPMRTLHNGETVAVSTFVKRQIRDSEFSHFEGTWDELLILVGDCFCHRK